MATERHKGDKVTGIPTDDWNEFCRTAKTVSQFIKNPFQPGQSSVADTLTIQVFNETGAQIEARFPILKITAPAFTFEDRESVIDEGISFNGDTPDSDTTIADIVIVQGPIQDGVSGPGIKAGYSWCEVDVTDEAHTHAAPSDGDNEKLASGSSGASILWKESGTGTKKAVVLLGGGGGSDAGKLFKMIVVVDILEASGDTDEITPGVGTAIAVTTDGTTKAITPVEGAEPQDVYNYDPLDGYDTRTLIWAMQVEPAGGEPFLEAVVKICGPLTAGAGWAAILGE